MKRNTVVVLSAFLWASVAAAQVPDHLKCYKVKDSLAKTEYTADLTGLAPEPGCVIKAPAKLLCVETPKTNVTPPSPGAPAGAEAGRFACYKAKCAKGTLAPVPIIDQFGAREVKPSAAKLLCAPVCPAHGTPIPPEGGTFTGTTVGGTPGASCTVGNVSPERRFLWTPAVSGTATVETCGGITDYQSRLAVRDECDRDPAFGLLCGVGPNCMDGVGQLRAARLMPTVVAGVTYTIIVAGDNGSAGNFTLTVTPPP